MDALDKLLAIGRPGRRGARLDTRAAAEQIGVSRRTLDRIVAAADPRAPRATRLRNVSAATQAKIDAAYAAQRAAETRTREQESLRRTGYLPDLNPPTGGVSRFLLGDLPSSSNPRGILDQIGVVRPDGTLNYSATARKLSEQSGRRVSRTAVRAWYTQGRRPRPDAQRDLQRLLRDQRLDTPRIHQLTNAGARIKITATFQVSNEYRPRTRSINLAAAGSVIENLLADYLEGGEEAARITAERFLSDEIGQAVVIHGDLIIE